MLKSIWKTVQKANAIAPTQAQIHQNHVLFADPDKPFIRTDKGTIKRQATVAFYAREIDQFYDSREDQYAEEILARIDLGSLDSIASGVLKLISRIAQVGHLGMQDNVFAAGLDSLMVFRVLGALRGVLRNSGTECEKRVNELKPYFVYANATVQKLSSAFYELYHSADNAGHTESRKDASISKRAELIAKSASLLKKYTEDLPSPMKTAATERAEDQVSVLLTGSTGSLGSHLLENLIHNPRVTQVTCLNRSVDGKSKQLMSNSRRGLSDRWPEGKIRFFQADMSKLGFSLAEEVYEDLLASTTLVIRKYSLGIKLLVQLRRDLTVSDR